MEPYELDLDTIVEWATQCAAYEDLEAAAKTLYALYKERQKVEDSDKYRLDSKLAKEYKAKHKKHNKQSDVRKGDTTFAYLHKKH